MVSLLEASGHSVVFALDFDAALKALLEQPPDLLIADVRLEAYNGLHLAARCQSDYPATSMMLLDTTDDESHEWRHAGSRPPTLSSRSRTRSSWRISPEQLSRPRRLIDDGPASTLRQGWWRRWRRDLPAWSI